MKLKGYIKAIKENCFAIPIYGDGTSYYYHNISNDFKILSFEKTEILHDYFIQTYLSKTFDINSTAALIFVGFENFILYNSADEVIDEVIFFLKDLSKDDEYVNIKKEAFELQKILFPNKVIENEIENIDFTIKKISVNDLDSKVFVKYSLEDYLEVENNRIQNKDLDNIKEKIIKRQIENSILDKTLFNENKEVLFELFCNYLTDNRSIFESLIIDTNIGKSFTSYLSEKSKSFKPIEITLEEELKFRVNERRKKLKDFNYQFNFDFLKENLNKELAYKRYGIDINYIPHYIEPDRSKIIIFIDDKILSEEITLEEIKKSEAIKSERQKISK